jgi:hypothetical protein
VLRVDRELAVEDLAPLARVVVRNAEAVPMTIRGSASIAAFQRRCQIHAVARASSRTVVEVI